MKFRRLNPDRMKVFASFFKKKRLPYLSRASGSFLKKEPKNFHPCAQSSFTRLPEPPRHPGDISFFICNELRPSASTQGECR
jgi:hypothetical protein